MELALGKRFQWLGFFVQHASLIPALLELFQEWQSAEGIDGKAEVLKSLIDLLKSHRLDRLSILTQQAK